MNSARIGSVKKAFLLLACLAAAALAAVPAVGVQTPREYFGFTPGTDRMLFKYDALIEYLQMLDAECPRLKLVEIGQSPLGKKIYIAFISSPENIENLEELREINRRLALDHSLGKSEQKVLIERGKVFFLATLSMHSNEVGPSQSAPLLAYDLATTDVQETVQWLDDVVYMMVPCHNPDGMDMVVDNYYRYKDTKYEGCSLPGLYHKYVGHDNNRDFVVLSQSDTKAIARIYNTEWFPQVMVEKHQMGSTGTRYFVPPTHDPIAENVDAGIWNWAGIFGSNMIKDMTREGLHGVSQHFLFDDYWPGSTETCIWKNVIAFLTEAAGAKCATPIFVESNELRVGGKGLSEHKKSVNMPSPWPGGRWGLGNIIQYERVSTFSVIKTASRHRAEILKFRNDICQKEYNRGLTEPPYYYILPREQRDRSELARLVDLLREHGVRVYSLAEAVSLNNRTFAGGDIVVPLAQPYRPFIKEVMENQQYPVRHYTPGGEIIKPYDITSWSLPLHRGVESVEIRERSRALESSLEEITAPLRFTMAEPEDYRILVFPANSNESFKAAFRALEMGLPVERLEKYRQLGKVSIPAGSFIVHPDASREKSGHLLRELKVSPDFYAETEGWPATALSAPRIALVETWFHDMDAGWTRFVLDTYHIPFSVLRPADFEKTDLIKKFDVVIFPNSDKSILTTGKYKSPRGSYFSSYPPEYSKGMGKKGQERLMSFLDRGGIIVSWGRSTDLFTDELEISRGKDDKEEFQLPVRNIAEQIEKQNFYCPGALVKVLLTPRHPLTWGMPDEIGVFFRGNPVFTTSVPRFDMDRRMIAKFPEKDILLSGYAENIESIGDRTAMVWLRKGKGQLVLFAFGPQFRASTAGSYKLLFNALLLPRIK
ncbi:MAG: hypothetical protein JXB45_01430 [Candidatus Krumholzibacteriota bacterium]|nr:hypothetical protein [Candidatus Krumholzibacteriota bacterium]